MEFSLTNNKLNTIIDKEEEKKGIILVWGDLGVGKTTLCLNASLSKLERGKKVIYINTKSFFKKERMKQIAEFYPDFDMYNFILYQAYNFEQELEIVLNLEFLILKEIEKLGKTNIALIILDSTAILKEVSMGSDKLNLKLQRQVNLIIASLKYLLLNYSIPIILTSRSKILIEDNFDNSSETPTNAKTLDYWIDYSIKIERTNKTGVRKIIVDKHPIKKLKPIVSILTEKGFE